MNPESRQGLFILEKLPAYNLFKKGRIWGKWKENEGHFIK